MNNTHRLADLIPDAVLSLTGRMLPATTPETRPVETATRVPPLRPAKPSRTPQSVASVTVLHPPSAA